VDLPDTPKIGEYTTDTYTDPATNEERDTSELWPEGTEGQDRESYSDEQDRDNYTTE
jgi:hypothetical protein